MMKVIKEPVKKPIKTPDVKISYLYSTVKDYEDSVGFKVNMAFRMGFDLARLINPDVRSD